MTTKRSLPLSDEELETYEASRDLYAELKQSAKDLQNGLGRIVYSPLIAAREKAGLTQRQFAELLGISAEKLNRWEQQREEPTDAAMNLVALLLESPTAVDEILAR